MKARLPLLLCVTLLIAADGPNKDTGKAELEKLQGTWTFTALEIDGMKYEEKFFADAKIEIKGDAFTPTMGGFTYKGTVKIDPTKEPKTIDLNFTDGPEKGNTSSGIYKLDGESWTICLTVTSKERPKEFATKAGSGIALESLKKAKP